VSARLRLRERVVDVDPRAPLLMGVVNASPESFSDGASVGGVTRQAALAQRLVDDGADIIDVGGESGVTNVPPIGAEEEIRRVVPLVERLAADGIAVSVDTWKPAVARAAVAAGAVMINDVSGLRDPALAEACADSGAALVVMHTAAPPKRKEFPGYRNLVGEVRQFLAERMAMAKSLGVGDDQLVVDPGPDFAKTPAETVEMLQRLGELVPLGRPILLAVSRKDFIGALTARPPSKRLAGTLAALGAGVDAGASIARVHDVAAARDYLDVRRALRGDARVPADLRLAAALMREPPA
jgi:dihydropteroate synthase